jgi:beta-carotene hydroxylase
MTSYLPHQPEGAGPLHQTRLFRGKLLAWLSVEHLYHLEHHLYPQVPHHRWPQLAKRLDAYFAAAGLKPIVLWK